MRREKTGFSEKEMSDARILDASAAVRADGHAQVVGAGSLGALALLLQVLADRGSLRAREALIDRLESSAAPG